MRPRVVTIKVTVPTDRPSFFLQAVVTAGRYSGAMTTGPDVIWRLHGAFVRNIVCLKHATKSGLVLLQVVLDDEALLEELYPDVRSATARANGIRDTLLDKGWATEAAA